MQNTQKIYLDSAATTPVDSMVMKEMVPFFSKYFGNPNSPHHYGQDALIAVDKARKKVAGLLNCNTNEIVFTSGATESNNLAIRGVIKKFRKIIKSPEIITTMIEHPSVLNTCLDLEKEGIKIKYLPINKSGLVDISHLVDLISESTVLVTIMHANNEIGTVEPIRDIGKIIEKINKDRKYPIIFHTDAVQTVSMLNSDVKYLHVDLLSMSGHKIYGPKGIGALYIKDNTPISGVQTGGDQEYSLRAGTLPVPLIVGMGAAAEICKKRKLSDKQRMIANRDWVYKKLRENISSIVLTGLKGDSRLPNNLHLRVDGIRGEDIMFLLDTKYGIEVSTGSACSAGAPVASKIMLAMGFDEKKSREGIRVTFGRWTKRSDLNRFIRSYTKIVAQLSNNAIEMD